VPGPAFRAAPVRVRVPATAANLGPGFDALGLALARYDDVVVRVAEAGLSVDVAGEGAETLPRGARHLVVRALRETFAVLGGQPRGLEVVCANRIPQARGLGSSAAAIVAGVLAARALKPGGDAAFSDRDVLRLAARLEGHPDNVAACLSGGLTVCWVEADGPRAARVPVDRGLAPVIFIPTARSATTRSRRLLPETVPHQDAAHAAGRAALLVTAIGAAPDLLLAATEDRLHQPYRAPAMPRSMTLVDRLRAAGVAAMLSGAGPAVLALCRREDRAAVLATAARGFAAVPLDVDRDGARVLPLEDAGG
jgi:homoserine kinase